MGGAASALVERNLRAVKKGCQKCAPQAATASHEDLIYSASQHLAGRSSRDAKPKEGQSLAVTLISSLANSWRSREGIFHGEIRGPGDLADKEQFDFFLL
jgi:hypothetical protein